MKRYKDTGGYKSKTRSGRPRVTTATTDRMIRRLCVTNPTASSLSITNSLHTLVSTRTIRRRLSLQFNLKAYRPAKKPFLSAKNIKDRLNFVGPTLTGQQKCGVELFSATRQQFDNLQTVVPPWYADHPEHVSTLDTSYQR